MFYIEPLNFYIEGKNRIIYYNRKFVLKMNDNTH